MQFQDRIRQILEVVDADMGRLGQTLDDKDMPTTLLPTLESWLVTLESCYTMDDERDSQAARHGGKKTPEPSDDVTFF